MINRKYRVVTGMSPEALNEHVNNLMNHEFEIWEPLGGVATNIILHDTSDNEREYAQAMMLTDTRGSGS